MLETRFMAECILPNRTANLVTLILVNLQPSELTKLFVVLYAADYTVRKAAWMHSFKRGFLPMFVVMLCAGALLLPPELVLLMGAVQHVPEWLKHRYAWYIQTFNIANYTLDGLAAWGGAKLVLRQAPGWVNAGPRTAVAGLAACVVFVGLNHALMAGMLYLARGHRPGETGLFSAAMLSTDSGSTSMPAPPASSLVPYRSAVTRWRTSFARTGRMKRPRSRGQISHRFPTRSRGVAVRPTGGCFTVGRHSAIADPERSRLPDAGLEPARERLPPSR